MAVRPRRSPFARLRKFNTKFILVTGFSVLIGAVLNPAGHPQAELPGHG
jgi:hypothetical protein